MLLSASKHNAGIKLGIIGSANRTGEESKRIENEARELGIECNVHCLPSDNGGYINGTHAEQCKAALKQMLKF